jgi:hypothetical protein
MIPSQMQLIHNVPKHDTVTTRQHKVEEDDANNNANEDKNSEKNNSDNKDNDASSNGNHKNNNNDHDNWKYLGFPEDMDEIYIEPLLDVYDWQKMDPKAWWEQQQMMELEEFIVQEQITLDQDDLEQLQQIEAVQQVQEEEQRQQNEEQLAQIQQWEQIAFLIQQINET